MAFPSKAPHTEVVGYYIRYGASATAKRFGYNVNSVCQKMKRLGVPSCDRFMPSNYRKPKRQKLPEWEREMWYERFPDPGENP